MKRIITLLMLLAFPILYISCSDNDDPNPDNGKDKETIDPKLIGKWKVEYSKTISPARYDEKAGKPVYDEDALILEYFGNYGEPDVVPRSSMFGSSDVWIEIEESHTIDAYNVSPDLSGFTPKTSTFDSMNNGYLIIEDYTAHTFPKWKYYFYKEHLIIEFITPQLRLGSYTISRYSRIQE